MVVADFKQKLVFIDTAPLIYFIEGNSIYQNVLTQFFLANDAGEFPLITSTITLLEVLVKPIKANEFEIVELYKNILTKSSGIETIKINNAVAIKAAEIRAKYNLKTPDAIQIATAIENSADYFFTNDERLKNIEEITVLSLKDIL
ncbi:MAG: type II toxin-antitoxin system VapC family toxin [Candidatus Methylacidiphilales bacterium]